MNAAPNYLSFSTSDPASRYLNKTVDDLNDMLEELKIVNTSLWTIDIAHLCALKNVKHKMFTLSWGVEDSYQSNEYYTKDRRFLAEKERVNHIFGSHEKLGICVELKEVGLDLIRVEISSDDEKSLDHVKYFAEAS